MGGSQWLGVPVLKEAVSPNSKLRFQRQSVSQSLQRRRYGVSTVPCRPQCFHRSQKFAQRRDPVCPPQNQNDLLWPNPNLASGGADPPTGLLLSDNVSPDLSLSPCS